MKINAPEKIYLPYKDGRLIGIVKTEGVRFSSGVDGHIEYVRKDAFIEKALKFIKTNVDRIVNNQHGVCMGCMDVEFRNYMKGE